jgi:hypothetical protein
MALVQFPWDRVPSEESVIRRLPPLKVPPLVLWNIGNKYVAFGRSAEILDSIGICPLLKSKLNNRVVTWAFISRDTDLSVNGVISRKANTSILLVN